MWRSSARLFALLLTFGSAGVSIGAHESIEEYSRKIESDPSDDAAYFCRGKLYFEQNELQPALVDLTRSIVLDDSEAEKFVYRAMVWQELKHFRFAISDWDEAAKRKPLNRVRLELHLMCNFQLERWDEVIKQCDELTSLDPEWYRTYLMRAESQWRMGNYMLAKEDFETAFSLNATDMKSLDWFAFFLAVCPVEEIRDIERALDLANRACIETDWRESGPLECLAVVHYAAGHTDEAISTQEWAIKHSSKNERQRLEDRLAKYRDEASLDKIIVR